MLHMPSSERVSKGSATSTANVGQHCWMFGTGRGTGLCQAGASACIEAPQSRKDIRGASTCTLPEGGARMDPRPSEAPRRAEQLSFPDMYAALGAWVPSAVLDCGRGGAAGGLR